MWQPIETAPRDAGSILLWVPENLCTFMAVWQNSAQGSRPSGWCIFGGDWRTYLQTATHWQHRPEPPGL